MKFEWEEKVWGRVVHIFQSASAAVSFLEVNKGFQCSRHYHNFRANQFSVISGHICIEVWVGEKDYRSINLHSGETYVVPSGRVHRFNVIESGSMIEVYWPDKENNYVSISDIERIDTGGLIEDQK